MPKAYRIVPLGPTGAGKSQLCNFIYMDKSNMKFEVSDGLDSQTKFPQCEYCVRKIKDENINIELIDTAGCSDSGGSDEENFKYLIEELKKKKSIDLFLLVFNFTNRIDGKTKDYMKLIANTFTPTEFFNHLAIIFTFYPENPSDMQIKKKEKITSQIIGIIKDTIGLADGQTTFCPAIYELDTEKKNGNFIEKFQATIDIILLKMQMINKIYGEVNTENIRFCGVKDRLKEEQEKLEKQRLENERIQKENEEKSRKLEEDKKKLEKIKEEQKKIQKLSEDEKIKMAKEREELDQRIQEQIQKQKEQDEENQKKEEELKKKAEEMEKIKNEYDIKIRNLDELIKVEEKKSKIGAWTFGIGVGLSFIPFGFLIGIPTAIAGAYIHENAEANIRKYRKEKKEYE
jgi:outer membrane biosynthesis protein TonB